MPPCSLVGIDKSLWLFRPSDDQRWVTGHSLSPLQGEQFAIILVSHTVSDNLLMKTEDIPSLIELCRVLSRLNPLYYSMIPRRL